MDFIPKNWHDYIYDDGDTADTFWAGSGVNTGNTEDGEYEVDTSTDLLSPDRDYNHPTLGSGTYKVWAAPDSVAAHGTSTGNKWCIWICYPKRLGTLASLNYNIFTGNSAGDTSVTVPTSFYGPNTIEFKNEMGWTEDYYCYRHTTTNLGKTGIEIRA